MIENMMRAQAKGYHPDLAAALDLLVAAGGKRIRPALTLLTGNMLGADHERLMTIAAAIELLHTATLVHDDLIDNALLRRGHPTLNARWSPGATVLTGDFLFAAAAKLAAQVQSNTVMQLFAQTLTVIVNGEVTQMLASRCDASRESYYQRIYAKTASLFETSVATAALISPVDTHTVEKLRQYGHEIGLAFQIVDDILDFTGEQATIGKPVGSDLHQGLITLPAIYYIEQHRQDPLVQNILQGNCPTDQDKVSQLINEIRASDSILLAMEQARQHVNRGLDALRHAPISPERTSLEDLANYITQRDL